MYTIHLNRWNNPQTGAKMSLLNIYFGVGVANNAELFRLNAIVL